MAAPEPLRLGGAFPLAARRAAARALIVWHSSVTAIFAFSNVSAAGVLHVLRRAGIAVPERMSLSLTAFDDYPYAPLLELSLTVIAQPVEEMGRRASRRLRDRVLGRADGPVSPPGAACRPD